MDHSITVADLSTVLAQLKNTDLLLPNASGNLSVIRDGAYVGYIDLAERIPIAERLKMVEADTD